MKARTDYIKIKDLKGGYLYYIDARNASYGIWIPEKKAFAISRIKFFDNFIFEEHHWDCEAFATVKPLKEVEKSPFEPENLVTVHIREDGKTTYFGYKDEEKLLEYLNLFEGDRDYLKPMWKLHEEKDKQSI